MAYLQEKTNNYFGFQPVDGNARVSLYLVSSSEANAIYPGDTVCWTTDDASPAYGTVRVTTGGTSTDAGVLVGVAASYVAANGGSTAASHRSLSSQNLLVYDDPNTLFVGCDSTSGLMGQGDVTLGKAVAVLSTGVMGTTGPSGTLLRSVMAISAVSASSGSGNGYRFQVIGVHPIESALSTVADGTASTGSGTDAGVRKLLLRMYGHYTQDFGRGRIST